MRQLVGERDEALAIDRVDRARTDDQARVVLFGDRPRVRARSPPGCWQTPNEATMTLLRRDGFGRMPQRVERRELRIEHHADVLQIGRHLPQQLHPLADDLRLERAEPSDVAAGPRQVRHIAGAERIADHHEHHRNAGARRTHGVHAGRAVDDDDVHLAVRMGLGGRLRQLEAAAVPAYVDGDVPPVGPARIRKRAAECFDPAQSLGIVFARWPSSGRCASAARTAPAPRRRGRRRAPPSHGSETSWRRFTCAS